MTAWSDWQAGGADPRAGLEGMVHRRWPAERAAPLARFATAYYAGVEAEDVEDRPVASLYGQAIEHWRLGYQRRPQQPRLAVYNPDPEQHGWESRHTVIDLVVDDRPFLIDSLSMALQDEGLTIHRVVHPVLRVARDADGHWQDLADDADGVREAYMHFEVDRRSDPQHLEHLRDTLLSVLAQVVQVVDDWGAMRDALKEAAGELADQPPPAVDPEHLREVRAFLDWIARDHFTFLGYRAYALEPDDASRFRLEPLQNSALGLMRTAPAGPSVRFAALPSKVQQRALEPDPLILTQSNSRSPVHRPGYMDYIGVKRFNTEGEVIGEHRFLGLYTSAAYYRSAQEIPLLRSKVAQVLTRAGYPPDSHAGKALLNILETYPRDELFQIDPEELERLSIAILHLQERRRIRLLVRYDPWQRFISSLVYVPRERYDTHTRRIIQRLLERAAGAEQSDFSVQLGESPLARIRFILRLTGPHLPELDTRALERRLVEALRSWSDAVREALTEACGEEQGSDLAARYAEAFPAAYRETVAPRVAAQDIRRIEQLRQGGGAQMVLYHTSEGQVGELRFKLLHGARPATLSDALPVLENLGVRVVDEQPFEVVPAGGEPCWIHDFGLLWEGGGILDSSVVATRFEEAFAAVWQGRSESDGLNRLVLAADVAWSEIAVLRSLARYLRQIAVPFSQAYMEETLVAHAAIAQELIQLFHRRFDPQQIDDAEAETHRAAIEQALGEVGSLDEDRILRWFLAAVLATVRTNVYAVAPGEPVALKLHPGSIPELPRPAPWAEVFVYSPRMEGVHLRGGEVSRGGIRWSDRREDFRGEVLGLMKAQMVKNAAIVPVGAKGGFVIKSLPAERDAQRAAVRGAYRAYVSALLQVTDNLADDQLKPPPGVHRRDDDDPYLVVAADKGTATFSDLANSVSREQGFWLRDAFASGGSAGYDHKRMGITARGAWESVRRHFHEMGWDIHRDPFTAVGIGDMSGDVFGNGMLLSRQIRLVAAFDHRHVFIDPDPDPATSYEERRRLFQLEGSCWNDYDRSCLSAGGGIFPRTAKSIELSAPARAVLGVSRSRLTPNEVIRAVLSAPVDLLWNGGIGTYVKASTEAHAAVGDKMTEAVRIDASQLRCRVVGEGGNLGFTQQARVEYALGGGRINTDAIDNVGGVACSDQEVNIKILLNQVVEEGDLTQKHRDELLARMTEAVADRVLATCRAQSGALSLAEYEAAQQLSKHGELIRWLEREGSLDRALEALPDEASLAERAGRGQGLVRPELAVLLAHTKIHAKQQLLRSDLSDEGSMERLLFDYFPAELGEGYPQRVTGHRLRRELIATQVANRVVDRMGETFFARVAEKSGAEVPDIARSWFVADGIFGFEERWSAVEHRGEGVAHAQKAALLVRLRRMHEEASVWLLRNMASLRSPADCGGIEDAVQRIRPLVQRLAQALPGLLPARESEAIAGECDRLEAAGLPAAEAARLVHLFALRPALDWVRVSESTRVDLLAIAANYYRLVDTLDLGCLRRALYGLESQDLWQERFRDGLLIDYDLQVRALVAQLVTRYGTDDAALEKFLADRGGALQRLGAVLGELEVTQNPGTAIVAVALQELKAVVQVGDAGLAAPAERAKGGDADDG